MNSFFSAVALIGASQGLVLTLGLFFKKKNLAANKILAVLIFCFTIDLVLGYLSYTLGPARNINAGEISLEILGYSISLLYGPLLLYYSLKLTSSINKFKSFYLLHLIPFVLYFIYGTFYLLISDETSAQNLLLDLEKNWPLIEFILFTLYLIQIIIYCSLIILFLNSYSRRILKFYSSIKNLGLNWLKINTLIILLSSLVSLFILFYLINSNALSLYLSGIYYSGMSLIIIITGYVALVQPEIFNKTDFMAKNLDISKTLKNNSAKNEEKDSEKYKKTRLDDEKMNNYYNRIISYITDTQIYTDPELNLQKLAEKLSIPSHHISQVINTRKKENFYSFINNYRVEEVKKALTDPKKTNFSILEIAFDAGFNTKSNFNTIFKKYTGLTPSQYKKMNQG